MQIPPHVERHNTTIDVTSSNNSCTDENGDPEAAAEALHAPLAGHPLLKTPEAPARER